MEKQTAVNWLVHQLNLEPDGWMKHLIEQAKEMEKNQLIDFARFRDEYFDKANTMEEFTISDEELIEKFKQNL